MKFYRVFILLLLYFVSMSTRGLASEKIDLSGSLIITGAAYNNLNLMDSSLSNSQESFDVFQRFEINLALRASENLEAYMSLYIPSDGVWGEDSFAIGDNVDDTNEIEFNLAYIDFFVPSSQINLRMGMQNPAYNSALGSAVLDDSVVGISLTSPVNEHISLNASWFRPQSDFGKSKSTFDVFALSLPMIFDKINFTPWFIYGIAGDNFVDENKNENGINPELLSPLTANPLKFGQDEEVSSLGLVQENNYWFGFNAEFNVFDPIKMSLGFTYAGTDSKDTNQTNAYLIDASLSYHAKNGSPMLFAWYSSGDSNDADAKNHRRIPEISASWDMVNTLFFDQSIYDIAAGSDVSSPTGTWGVGLAYNAFEIFKDVQIGGHAMYIAGTNEELNTLTAFDPRYLTKEMNIVELGMYTSYDIYKNLQMAFEFNYLIGDFSNSNFYGAEKNAYRALLGFQYDF